MKLSNRTLLAGLIFAMVSVTGAAQATTVLDGVSTKISDGVGLSVVESKLGLGPSSTLPELPSWALMLLGLTGIALTSGNHQAKKRREAIAYF